MMVPPGTTWPPNALNPSRCAFESRPLRELPNPFLWAIKAPWLFASGCQLQLTSFLAACLVLSEFDYFFFFRAAPAFAFGAALFLALALLAGLAALAWGCAPSVSVPASAAVLFGLGLRSGSSGAANRWPSKAISVMRTAV